MMNPAVPSGEFEMSGDVVVGFDGSQRGLAALTWACDEAGRRGAALRVVHVAAPWAVREPSDPRVARVHVWARDSARQIVDQGLAAARHARPAVEVTGTVRYGEPARELLAAGIDASLLVTGGRGTGGFAGLLLGSVALHVTAHATCPVVVVRHDQADGPAEGYGNGTIVLGLDGSAEAGAAARFAAAEAALRGARLRALRAVNSPLTPAPPAAPPGDGARVEDPDRRDDERAVAAVLAELRESSPGVEVDYEVAQGRAAGILTAASADADLVAVGSRGRSALRGLVLGSVSHALLHHARCPVAVVRSYAPRQRPGIADRGPSESTG